MRILVTGATGFIGGQLIRSLSDHGHKVIGAARGNLRRSRIGLRYGWMPVDFNQAIHEADWVHRLRGKRIDVVINAVGILRETSQQSFEHVHYLAPRALFSAAAKCGVRQIIQISALGAGAGEDDYFASKRSADVSLLAVDIPWVVLRPSIIYGRGSDSTRLFQWLASLPVIPLIGGGQQKIQPLHVRELAYLIERLMSQVAVQQKIIDVVGDQAVTFKHFLTRIRQAQGKDQPCFISVPYVFAAAAGWAGDRLHIPALSLQSIRMLNAGSTSNSRITEQLLGHRPQAGLGESINKPLSLTNMRLRLWNI